ncbi:(S)-benzoin forming benzil reductase [Cohnella faecalis]|uniref:(S)-benzoin forming benzil reductase n=1 Tax=Cohnella faecalis TaxID=2315694 RepID=A0A398CQ12_9BACL|nr:(S)-benzoin forming benzil reductase [Cohnella faecalis]RIE03389.1 (S)-benzoin forming benzil reductase [Cohnella faecalis]
MKYYIVTGTSRGLGEAIAEKLIASGNHITCISRGANERLVKLAEDRGAELNYISFDLSRSNEIEAVMRAIFAKIDKENAEAVILINNAGILAPIKPIESCSSEEIILNNQINLVAPMILSSSFIALAADIRADKQIVHISSGAGKKPYFGWSSYCSAKAGLDMYTRCAAVEQQDKEYPVRVVSFAPGVVDTAMQQEIRSTGKEYFRDIERFIALKEEGVLLTPEYAADKLLSVIASSDIENGAILHISQFQ